MLITYRLNVCRNKDGVDLLDDTTSDAMTLVKYCVAGV